jgi:hypothetical protein
MPNGHFEVDLVDYSRREGVIEVTAETIAAHPAARRGRG